VTVVTSFQNSSLQIGSEQVNTTDLAGAQLHFFGRSFTVAAGSIWDLNPTSGEARGFATIHSAKALGNTLNSFISSDVLLNVRGLSLTLSSILVREGETHEMMIVRFFARLNKNPFNPQN
jgi:hypothetical protein